MEKSITTDQIKEMNKSTIYKYIYQSQRTSKQEISHQLHMGLTTITQNIKLLEKEGLIQRKDFFQSTGGRKAYAIEIKSDFRTSIGIEILKNQIYIVCIDLYGHILAKQIILFPFESSLEYCQKISELLNQFIQKNHIIHQNILGVNIVLQGIVSQEGTSVIYNRLLDYTTLTLADFQQYISYPCRFEHDSKAAAYLECWHKDEFRDAIVLLLNNNFGSAIVLDGKIHKGKNVHSGLIEHMIIHPNGPLCYCGQHGCLETYCSAEALSQNGNIDEFFELVRHRDSKRMKIWKDYLQNLAIAIHHFHTVIDVPIIISGYLASYINQDDLNEIVQFVQNQSAFAFDSSYLHISQQGNLAPAIGGALYSIDEFLKQI